MIRRTDDPGPADPPAPTALPDFTPVPRKRMRRGGWSAARQRAFIEHLAETGSVRAACRRMGVGERPVYALRNHPEGASFRAAWEAALDMGIQRIEDVAMDRALNGVDTPVFYHGEEVGQRKVYNDRLLMFMLNNRAPTRFGHGNARALGTVSQAELARLKSKWRAEWDAEHPRVTTAEVRDSIDRKIEAIRAAFQREAAIRWAALAEETRAAWAHFTALRERDLAAMDADPRTRELLEVEWDADADLFDPPDPPDPPGLPGPREAAAEEEGWRPPEGWSYGKPKEPEPPKTRWTLKDHSFDP